MPLDYQTMQTCMRVLDIVSQGKTTTAACREAGTTFAFFMKQVRVAPELGEMLLDAEQQSRDMMADSLVEIDRTHSDPKIAKVISDNIKWLLSKRDDKRFGDKVTVNNHITADRAILEALDAAKFRTIDVTPTKTAPLMLEQRGLVVEAEEDISQFL